MKKSVILWAAMAAMGIGLLSSCDTKKCYCYEGGYESVEYVFSDKSCNSLSTTNMGCIESSERGSFDPNQTGSRKY